MKTLKLQIHQACIDKVEERIQSIQNLLKEVQGAANNETKSSAGDKYETGRAMAHLETEKLAPQLKEAQKQREILSSIKPNKTYTEAQSGSLVKTKNGLFYISVGLGKITVYDTIVFAISPISPIGQLLLNKKPDDSYSFNGVQNQIEYIY